MNRRELLVAAAAVPLSLALPERGEAGGLGGTPLVLVTADLESHVAVVDVTSGRVVRRIQTIAGPRSIESAFSTWAVVAHTASGRLSVVHAPTRRVRVVDGLRSPRYAAVHPTRWPSDTDTAGSPLAYVTDSTRRELVTLDVPRARILWRTAVPGPARHVTVDSGGRRLYTALGSKADRIAVLDLEEPRRPRLARTFATPFLAHDVVCDPSGRHLWVSSGDERRLAIYELDGRQPLEIVPAGSPPQHVAFGDRGLTYVASGDDGTVRRHSGTGTLLDETRVPVGSYNVTSPGIATRLGAVTPSLARGTLAMLGRDGRVRGLTRVARAAHDACLVVAP